MLTALAAVLALALALPPTLSAPSAAAAEQPTVELSKTEAGKGGSITVKGEGWRPTTLLTLLICGQNMIGGTNACANADGLAVTTDAKGRFSKKLPVAEPPKPCPCVVHVATVTGAKASAQAELKVAGHPVKPLPEPDGGERIRVLAATRLEGSSGVLTWFGAPASRRLVVTIGNFGTTPVKDPLFEVGTSHGVFAPGWEEREWRGTLEPGKKAQVKLPVQLNAGAHGDYVVSLRYEGRMLVEQPWEVGRPWGVTLFWILLALVVPAAVFRIGMAVVDRVRPRGRPGGRRARRSPRRTSPRLPKALAPLRSVTERAPATRTPHSHPHQHPAPDPHPHPDSGADPPTAGLPWFTPDTRGERRDHA
ncbi:neocarzinostatin apoprotein domain-containing protein [Streptomyces apocyni]|uniref:neocarzinostatin apoprotein domain-containing protein n=1 Tax=Streptomyces apocyni TaxID=2654677 RepID=UPI002D80ACA4|nr:neocarzinostatin apoprotein domain-containing protein [Streptomyces apocyni]